MVIMKQQVYDNLQGHRKTTQIHTQICINIFTPPPHTHANQLLPRPRKINMPPDTAEGSQRNHRRSLANRLPAFVTAAGNKGREWAKGATVWGHRCPMTPKILQWSCPFDWVPFWFIPPPTAALLYLMSFYFKSSSSNLSPLEQMGSTFS
jgi:hypothetical protein